MTYDLAADREPSTTHAAPPLRVLVVEQSEGLWGAERYLLRLSPLLADRGVEQVLAGPQASAMAQAWRDMNLRHVPLDLPARRGIRVNGDEGSIVPRLAMRELRRSVADGQAIARAAAVVGADVIQANTHWSHLESAIAGRIARRPAVLHLHEASLPGIARHLRAISVRLATATVAVSSAVADGLPWWAGRATVIRNGVDPIMFAPGAAEPETRREMSGDPTAPLVLVMCRLDPRKGVDDVIRAVAALPSELGDVRLAVVGSSSLQPRHAETLYTLGARLLGDRIRFLGQRDDVLRIIRSADIVALASRLEGLPLGILEAQAAGTPVVAYPVAGVPEVVQDGETGLLARAEDTEQLSACMARLIRDPLLRRRIAQTARARVVADFSIDRQADRQAALLRNLVTSR